MPAGSLPLTPLNACWRHHHLLACSRWRRNYLRSALLVRLAFRWLRLDHSARQTRSNMRCD
jgi:hypothetical protein